jgi:hypothetical protein
MSIERIFYCDWRDCEAHTRTASNRPGMSFLTVEEDAGDPLHFCSWDCVLKHAAEMPPLEVIALGDG